MANCQKGSSVVGAQLNCREDMVQLEALYSMNVLSNWMLRLLHDESFSFACALLDDEQDTTIGCILGKVLGPSPQRNGLQYRSVLSC